MNSPGPMQRALAGVDMLFRARVTERRAPSAVYGVFTRDGLVHTGSTGEVAASAPTADTVYRIASCTKGFTATALLALRDEGVIGLDDPITDYVPAFADVALPTGDSPVPTVRMLMTMSAGLPTDDPWGDRQESISDADLDALLRRGLRFDTVPGTRFAYSNLGYALLGRVVAEAAGKPYREVVRERILRPLGLHSTGFELPAVAGTLVATGHRHVDDAWQPLPFSGPGAFSPIGGLFSTVTDLSRWARWLAAAFDDADDVGAGARTDTESAGAQTPGDQAGILSRASRRELQQAYRVTPSLPTQPSGYGFGLFVEEQPELGTVVSHSGGYPGFSAHMRWHPASGIGIVAFENATYAQVSAPATSALHGLLREIGAARVPEVWPETNAARALVEQVLGGADLSAARFSENVELDLPVAHRRAAWQTAIDDIGGLAEPLPGETVTPTTTTASPPATATSQGGVPTRVPIDSAAGEESDAPSHLVWRLPGQRGRLRVEIRLTPESPPRVQTVVVRSERF